MGWPIPAEGSESVVFERETLQTVEEVFQDRELLVNLADLHAVFCDYLIDPSLQSLQASQLIGLLSLLKERARLVHYFPLAKESPLLMAHHRFKEGQGLLHVFLFVV